MSILLAIEALQERIEKARQNAPMASAHVTLLGASKGQAADRIEKAISGGLRSFGENRVQEAADKWTAIKERHPNLALHLIGPLQTNKVRQAVALFDVIQTVDREKLADALAQEMARTNKMPDCYIQVNTGSEPQKAGVLPQAADIFITYCISTLNLPVKGLMCIPPHGQPPAPHFALLKSIADHHDLKELSMGMSEDFETAVRMGSTCIRIGRALFGERS